MTFKCVCGSGGFFLATESSSYYTGDFTLNGWQDKINKNTRLFISCAVCDREWEYETIYDAQAAIMSGNMGEPL